MNSDRSDLRQAAEPLLALAASALAGVVGYAVAVSIFQDGERATVGFLWGTSAFAFAVWVLAFALRKAYRERGGSPWLVAVVAALLPAIMLLARGI